MQQPNGERNTYKEWWTQASSTYEHAMSVTVEPRDQADFDGRGWTGDSNSPGAQQLVRDFCLDKTSKVLEIGCGIARLGKVMAPCVAEWHGLDISPNMLEFARKRCEGLNNVHFHEINDILDLRTCFENDTFDFVYATVVLMHLEKEDVLEYMRQAFRITKLNGRAYFDTWNIAHPDSQRIWRDATPPGEPKTRGRIHCSSQEEFRILLELAGWYVDSLAAEDRLLRASCTKVTATVPAITDDRQAPFGYIATPESYATLTPIEHYKITGFCLDLIEKVVVLIDGKFMGSATYGAPSPQVAGAFPHYPNAAKAWFEFEIDLTKLAPGKHELTVLATDSNGKTAPVTGLYYAFELAEQAVK